MAKRYSSLTAWLNDVNVRRLHGVSDTASGVLVVVEVFGPHDIGTDQRSELRPQARVKIGYQPGATVLWTAVWDIPEDVDLNAYGIE